MEGVRQRRRSYRDLDDDDVLNEDLATVHERLDDLTRQLERMAKAGLAGMGPAPQPPTRAADLRTPDHVADALARLDRRLDQVISEGRAAAATHNPERRPRHAPPPDAYEAPPQAYASPPQAYASPPQAYASPPHAYASPRQAYAPQPAPAPAPSGPTNWAAQISARQRALDGGPASAPPLPPQPVFATTPPQPAPAPPPPSAAPASAPAWGPPPDLAGVEHQLRQINSQISSLQQQPSTEHVLHALRQDLAEIGRALTEALPRRAIESLDAEVRTLADKLDRTRQAGAEGAALAALERELADIRGAIQSLKPAESLVGFEDAVRALSHKIDHIAASAAVPQDPLAFKQLEQAVVSLRGVVSNVASDGALAQLAAEVRGLSSQFERAVADSSSEALTRLEARLAKLMESGRAVPPELEGSIRQLSERLDRVQLSQGDQLALGALEDRIAKLSEKLDASDARLGHLEAIERGLADLLVHLEEMRNGRGPRMPQPPEPAVAPAMPQQAASSPSTSPAPAAKPQSAADLIAELPPADAPAIQPQQPAQLAPLAPRAPAAMPQAGLAPQSGVPPQTELMPPPRPARQMPRGPERPPIDPNLPPDTPLEPGSGAPKVRPGSAAARIAASEAALSGFRTAAAENNSKSAAIAAARQAAKSAYLVDSPVNVPKTLRGERSSLFKWPFKKKAAAEPMPQMVVPAMPAAPTMPAPAPAPAPADTFDEEPTTRGGRIGKIIKTILIAASVAIIVLGTAQTVIDLLFSDSSAPPAIESPGTSATPDAAPRSPAPPSAPPRAMPTPQGALPEPAAPDPEPTGQIGGNASFFDPHTVVKPKLPLADITGSISRKPAALKPPVAAQPATSQPAASHAVNDGLPASISPMLRVAVHAHDPAAEYELGSRFAEGRGVSQNAAEAVRWFERAAEGGFVPAQFRLASIKEKGDGVRKDPQAARRLYMAAAGKGHAKAMHNLAVLYAEGIDGKPDYKTAAQWFLKAASRGVTDSQYNLAILYARGIGVSANLAESYRWFALAAARGDADAARKRDDVAARLDQRTLAAAKASVDAFTPEHEPDEATNLRTPPGGWDRAPAAPAKPKR